MNKVNIIAMTYYWLKETRSEKRNRKNQWGEKWIYQTTENECFWWRFRRFSYQNTKWNWEKEDLVIKILNEIEKTKTTNGTDMATVKFTLIKVYFKFNN